MDWTDIVIAVSSKDVDEAASIAEMLVSRGLYIEDYSTFEDDIKLFGPIEVVDEELLKKDKSTAKIHVYVSPEENPTEYKQFLTERLNAVKIKYEINTEGVCEEDWANNWKKFFKPMNIGEKLRLVPSWEAKGDKADPGRTSVVIDPGMAFGSGQHETTRLCMELLESHVTPETTMLDVGTGSGILGIAALMLGAKSCVGVDIDALSVKIAGENAELNGVRDKIELIQGDLAEKVHAKFNLITANIVADIIIRLLPDTERLLSDDGVIILSGIIDTRLNDVTKAIDEQKLEIVTLHTERGWCAIACRHKKEEN